MAHDRGKFTSRTKARKRAAEVLFEADQRGAMNSTSSLLNLLEERKTFTAAPSPLPEYAIRIVEGVAANRQQIDTVLANHTKGGNLDRLPSFDLAVLRVAMWEMMSNAEEVPPVVAIDEAVAVVKLISTDESPGLVNAVLDAVRRASAADTAVTSQSSETVNSGLEPVLVEGEIAENGPLGDDFDVDELLDEY